MGSSQDSLLNDMGRDDDVVALVPEAALTIEEVRSGGPTSDANGERDLAIKSCSATDVAVEQMRPASATHVSEPEPRTQTSPAPSAKSFKLMTHLDALARDFAVASGRNSFNQGIGKPQEGANFSVESEKVEPSLRVSSRPAGSTSDPSTSHKLSIGRVTVLALASFFVAALIGLGATLAWQYNHAAESTGSTPAARVSSPDTALRQAAITPAATKPSASATSPELVQQLQAIAQDLTVLRREVEKLAAEQDHLAAMQQQLDQLGAAQQQFAIKQEQVAQNIAKLQAVEQNIRYKRSTVPLSRAVPMPPRRNVPANAPPKSGAQASSMPRPPLPVPP
jgi:hypothetical protein